jgi:inosine-uridine nucleoside N-ribohydrolase
MSRQPDQPVDRRDSAAVDRLRRDWDALVAAGETTPGSGLADISAHLRAGGEWPPNLAGTPLILDTDIGGDADDAIAIVAAARTAPELTLVVTTDETGPGQGGYGQRARFARYLLDLVGRPDVAVVAGAGFGGTRYFCVDGLAPDSVPHQPTDVVAAVARLVPAADAVRWVGMGPLTNLATILHEAPDLASRLRVTQMGGALNYRDPNQAEHNIRLDVEAARAVLTAVDAKRLTELELVLHDVTFTPATQITEASPLYATLNDRDAPQWAHLLAEHLTRWFNRFYPHSYQHDPLTLTAALQLPFVDSDESKVQLDQIGRLSIHPAGTPVQLSVTADYQAFNLWLSATLDPHRTP